MAKKKSAKAEPKPAGRKHWSKFFEIHPVAEEYGMRYSDQRMDALKLSIAKNGLREPIPLWKDKAGKVWALGGRNRLEACEANGIELVGPKGKLEIVKYFKWLPADTDPLSYVMMENDIRHHLTDEEKSERCEAYLKKGTNASASDRAIAEVLCVSPTFIGKTRAKLVEEGSLSTMDSRKGKDGKVRSTSGAPSESDKIADGQNYDSPEAAAQAQAERDKAVQNGSGEENKTTTGTGIKTGTGTKTGAKSETKAGSTGGLTPAQKRAATRAKNEADRMAAFKAQLKADDEKQLAYALTLEQDYWNVVAELRHGDALTAAVKKVIETLSNNGVCHEDDDMQGKVVPPDPEDIGDPAETVAACKELIALATEVMDYAGRFSKPATIPDIGSPASTTAPASGDDLSIPAELARPLKGDHATT